MIRVEDKPRVAAWEDLGYGVKVLLRPRAYAICSAARSAAHRKVRDLLETLDTLRANGVVGQDLPDLSDPDIRAGLADAFYVQSLGLYAIKEWTGVESADGSSPAPVTATAIADLFDLAPVIADRFLTLWDKSPEVDAEKKLSENVRSGTSVEAPNTAAPVPTEASLAPGASAAPTASSVPTSATSPAA
ncbi:hypothetical protein N825_25415 [Skermanella stibiiresistens SB22]|uniref:Uncharacterized protein n=1 Tax=Skermanella stibiiresistens SB22 TaxID=1385369 RepID=W9GVW3_9PROT|nr:hypothetical protein [Skermanella stibiiresistens]EWY36776.1 hypothetical protein N825_25415 [Skermanella stibiiresistens SB22]